MTALHSVPRGLSVRLLALTVAFVMAIEVLIFVPALSRFRLAYLNDHIDAAHLAIFALEATPDNMVSQDLATRLLAHVGVHGIVVHKSNMTLMLGEENPPPIDATYDLRGAGLLMPMGDALEALARSENRVLRVLAISPKEPGDVVEVFLDEQPLSGADVGLRRAHPRTLDSDLGADRRAPLCQPAPAAGDAAPAPHRQHDRFPRRP